MLAAGLVVSEGHSLATSLDSDLDGCMDPIESGPFPAQGGERDHLNFWDLYDTPNALNVRDNAVAAADAFRVLQRFGATGDPMIDPFTAPPAAPAYHTAFDRGPSSGPNPWNLTAANGSIASTDFFAALAQFGHGCTSKPAGGMSLSGETFAWAGSEFVIRVMADPVPNFGIGGFATEVLFPPEASYISASCGTEVPVQREDGAGPSVCLKWHLGSGVRHAVVAGVSVPPLIRFATPFTTPLLELEFVCPQQITVDLTFTLTAVPYSDYGAAYMENTAGSFVQVPTLPQTFVADTHTITCRQVF
jgi:hypothetical protein